MFKPVMHFLIHNLGLSKLDVNTKIKIHDTAFMVNTYRVSNVALSKDTFAHLWVNSKVKKRAENYLEKVTRTEALTHCLRNRFFHDKIESFFNKHKKAVLVNFGAGFSMYPYQFSKHHMYIEIDQADVISYKKERVKNWVNKGVLPKREVHYYGCNFGDDIALSQLEQKLMDKTNRLPMFVLIEGVLFFLREQEVKNLFALFSAIQQKGDVVGSVSFLPEANESKLFQSLCKYFKDEIIKSESFNYSLFSDEFYASHLNYDILEKSDYITEAKKYRLEFRSDELINEQLYVFQNNN